MKRQKYSGSKILVIDDEKLILLTMGAKLKQAGYAPVCVDNVDEALRVLRENRGTVNAVITDIMMGEVDGFVIRDLVRGIDESIPIFFLTALDPEEGGGFLMRILQDPQSYYLPKSVNKDVLVNRVRRIVASRRIERFIAQKVEDDTVARKLGAHIQKSMLPPRARMTDRGFYTTCWIPSEVMSGDLYEALPFGEGCYLYVLGDIQGHGTSAAPAMTAVQSHLRHFTSTEGLPSMTPADIANILHRFFTDNLSGFSYMTALICLHKPLEGVVQWISCGAPDLLVVEDGRKVDANPEKRGSLPIGLLPDTEYVESDVVETPLSPKAICMAFTDGVFDVSKDREAHDILPDKLRETLCIDMIWAARDEGAILAAPEKIVAAGRELGYSYMHDDVTLLVFGARVFLDGVYEATSKITPAAVDSASQRIAEWCRSQGWAADLTERVQLVFEEKVANVHDHGFGDRERLREVVCYRLRKRNAGAELTVWDYGSVEPSLQVAVGDSSTAFEMANKSLESHGRGRLMVRELCTGVERNKYGELNETVYHIPAEMNR